MVSSIGVITIVSCVVGVVMVPVCIGSACGVTRVVQSIRMQKPTVAVVLVHHVVVAFSAPSFVISIEFRTTAVHRKRVAGVVVIEATNLNGSFDLSCSVSFRRTVSLSKLRAKPFCIIPNREPFAN
jgi:hypothetical protein